MTSNPDFPPVDASAPEIEKFVACAAASQRLEIAPVSLEPVKANIRILLQHASRITSFPLENAIGSATDPVDRLSK